MRPPLPISPTLMPASKDPRLRGSFRGTVYGDLVGSPYMIENTYNRYFDLGETRRAYSHGRVRPFFPEVTEVSHGAAATCRWLTSFRDSPTAENLLYCLKGQFDAHPRGGWTEPTRIFLTSGIGSPSTTPDWSAVTRSIPISSFVGALAGGILILRGKAKLGGMTAVPYGPFLALGVMTWMFWGPRIVNWYLHLHAFSR